MNQSIYFPHNANARNDAKVQRLLMSLGLRGYAVYFIILEMLTESSDHCLACDYASIAWSIRDIDKETVRSIVEDYDLFVTKKDETLDRDIFFSTNLSERLRRMDESREKRRAAGHKGGVAKSLRSSKNTENSSNAIAMPEQCATDALAPAVANSSNNIKEKKKQKNQNINNNKNNNKKNNVCGKAEVVVMPYHEDVTDEEYLEMISKMMRRYAARPTYEVEGLIGLMHPGWKTEYRDYSEKKSDACGVWKVYPDNRYVKGSPRASVEFSKKIDQYIEMLIGAGVHDKFMFDVFRNLSERPHKSEDGDIGRPLLVLQCCNEAAAKYVVEKHYDALNDYVVSKYGRDLYLEY